MARVLGVYEKGEAMTDTTSGRSYRIVLAAGVFVAIGHDPNTKVFKGQLEMDVSGDFSFDTPKHYTATIQSKGSVACREFVNTSVAIEGEHLGECQ